ncbi:MAG: hypothetical protein J6Y20_12160 [Lachnospiraceae bacterium]|jgi:predicted anti-sigma-YlaC factor YlaD|nr:hypothetical protein [Lachnospiraceae bacterium]
MDCRTALKLNERYLAEGLSDTVLAEYLEHIQGCESCRDNLMTDYSITRALDQINHNMDFSTDYSKELAQKLERSRQYLLRKKRLRKIRIAIVVLLMLLSVPLSVASSFGTAKFYKPEGSEESLRLQFYGIPETSDPIRNGIIEYNDEAVKKLRALEEGE